MNRLIWSWTICVFIYSSSAAVRAQGQQSSLTLSQATSIALKNNLQALDARERITEARGEKGVALSGLFPNLSGTAYQMNLTGNLATEGLPLKSFPSISAFVGPYSVFDARVQLTQTVFNLGAIRRVQASRRAIELASHEQELAVQQVTAATAIAYLSVLEARQSVAAAQADVDLAERLLALAQSQREAGVATGIDVARADTRLAKQQMQLAQAKTGLDTARLVLLRMIGLPLSNSLNLAEEMRFAPEPPPDLRQTIQRAHTDRIELKTARARLRIAGTQRKAALAELAPSVSFFGEYGSSGLKPNESNLPTRSVGVRIDVPIFNGGRTRSEVQIAASRQRQAEMQLNDLEVAIEKEVRQALDNLVTREEQAKAARKALSLAERELDLAQDRFQNGVADNIEVVNAQTAVETARQSWVTSLAQYNAARLSVAVASGHAEDFGL